MKNNEKKRFMYGIFALVLAISVGYFGISSMGSSYALEEGDLKCFYCTGQASNGKFYQWTASPEGECSGGSWNVDSNVTSEANCKASTYKCYHCTGSVSSGKFYQWVTTQPTEDCNGGSWTTLDDITSSGECKAPVTTCNIKYNLNGGTGSISDTKIEKTGKITSTVPERDGYTFNGWNIDNKKYNSGDDYVCPSSDDVIAYADWTLKTGCYSCSTSGDFKWSSGLPTDTCSGKWSFISSVTSSDKCTKAPEVKCNYNTLESCQKDNPKAICDLDGTISDKGVKCYSATLKETYKVTFNYNDGTTSDTVKEVNKDDVVSALSNPVREGYTFIGWYTDKDYKNKYDFNTKITSDITLYAKWEKSDKTDEEIDKNNKTGDVMMFLAWTIGIGALAYGVYYYKTRIED